MRTLILAVLMVPGSAWGLGGAITESPGPSVTPSSAAATYVNKAGDTMTGPLVGTAVTVSTLTVDTNTLKTSEGKVGIGTASPATKLHISSGVFLLDGTGPEIRIRGQAGVNSVLTLGGPGASATQRLDFQDSSGNTDAIIYQTDGNANLVFGTNGITTAMTLGSDYTMTVSTLAATYGGGSAHVCVTDAGVLFASEAACP